MSFLGDDECDEETLPTYESFVKSSEESIIDLSLDKSGSK